MENNKLNKISRGSEYRSLQAIGKREWPAKWLLLNYKKSNESNLRFGVTVSTKVGSSVIRNKLKRWCREYFRALLKNRLLVGIDVNVIFKPMPAGFYRKLEYVEFEKAIDSGIKKIIRFC